MVFKADTILSFGTVVLQHWKILGEISQKSVGTNWNFLKIKIKEQNILNQTLKFDRSTTLFFPHIAFPFWSIKKIFLFI